MKRSIALVSVLALSLAACSADDAPDDNGTAAPAGDEKITLRVATFNEFGYEDLIQDYMDDNPGIVVEHRKAATSN